MNYFYGIFTGDTKGVSLLTQKVCKVNRFNASMSYRKFRADYLFTGSQWLDNSHILITTEQGEVQTIVPLAEAGDNIETHTGILSPGFINCHCHLELSHLKGLIPEKSGMIPFLLTVIRQRNFPRSQILQAIADAEAAMLKEGIVATGDICNTADTLEQKQPGNMYYHNFIEATGFIGPAAASRFDECKKLYEKFAALYSITNKPVSIVPHAPYSVSPELFRLITAFPGNHLLTLHSQESEAENEFFLSGTGDFLHLFKELQLDISFYTPPGSSSLRSCLPYFLPGQQVILVHNAYTREEDLPEAPGFYYCLCPNANKYIGNRLPDVDMLRRKNSTIVIGTDSLASNTRLSVLSEVETLYHQYPHIEIAVLLQWATLNGARALGVQDKLGSFETGKRPGVLIIEKDLSGVRRIL